MVILGTGNSVLPCKWKKPFWHPDQMVTVALKRVDFETETDNCFRICNIHILICLTSGVRNAKCVAAQLAKEAMETNWSN